MDLWIFGLGGKVMSVQCKNCRNCYVFDKDKNQYSCGKEFQTRALVNINKQRECMYFINKVMGNKERC